MKPLPEQFKRAGFRFEQIKRSGQWALYRKTRDGAGGVIENYEVVRLRIRPAGEIFGKWTPEHESYPGNETWGTDGFTYQDEDTAREALRNKSNIGQEAFTDDRQDVSRGQPDSIPARPHQTVFIGGMGNG